MSAAAAAAGFLAARGLVKGGPKLCPYCRERFVLDVFEFHLFIAHKRTEAKR